MLASIFIAGGFDAVQNPESKAQAAEKVALSLARSLHLPEDPATLVRINGAVQVGAGALLALGWFPRLAATALAGSIVPTTLAGHRFWEEADDQARKGQRIHFLKNVSVLGGLLVAAVDSGGKPSLSWRARRVATRATNRAGRALPRWPIPKSSVQPLGG
ncbi:MAG: DoxX family protein [Acidimicrobiales bacterium]